MAALLATGPSPVDRSAFFIHLTESADQDGPSNQFSTDTNPKFAQVVDRFVAVLGLIGI